MSLTNREGCQKIHIKSLVFCKSFQCNVMCWSERPDDIRFWPILGKCSTLLYYISQVIWVLKYR